MTNKFFITLSPRSLDAIKGFRALEISRKLGLTPVTVLPSTYPPSCKIELTEKEARKIQGRKYAYCDNLSVIDFTNTNEITAAPKLSWDQLQPGDVSEIWEQHPDDPKTRIFQGYEFHLNLRWKEIVLVK